MVLEPADGRWAQQVTGDPVEDATAHVLGLSRALAARGHEVVVHVRRTDVDVPDRVETPSGVVVSRLAAGLARPLPGQDRLRAAPELGGRLADAWARDRPDVVHAHGWHAGLASLAAVHLLPSHSTPPAVVQTFHGLAVGRRAGGPLDRRSTSGSGPARERLEAAIARGADRVVALSGEEVGHLVALGASRAAVEVVPTGVEPNGCPPARHRAGGDAPARLLVVSRLRAEERVDLAVRALRAVPDAELLVVGGPPAENLGGDLGARRLLDLARRCRVADRVRLLGAIPLQDLVRLLRSTDVLVRTDPYEPSGRTVVEAMAVGVPVIGPAAGCLLDALVEGATGMLVPPGDTGALAVALRDLLRDPLRREGYGLAAAERARVRYGWDRLAEETERVYAGGRLRRSATRAVEPVECAAAVGPVPTGS